MHAPAQPTAVVLASGINGLGAIRTLARRGVNVAVVAESAEDPSLRSRLPKTRRVLRLYREAGGIEELGRVLRSLALERAVLVPTSDWFVSAINDPRVSLPDGFLPVGPSSELTALLVDKKTEAERVGKIVPIPVTVCPLPRTAEELLQELRLPMIVKPRSFEHMCLGAKNIVLRTFEDLTRFYADFPGVMHRVIAQEVIEGGDDNLWVCHAVFDDQHRMVSAVSFRRLRLSPPHYGVTSYAVTETNPVVLDLVRHLGIELGYVGPAMVEFKRDERDGTYRYIELNPRLGLANYLDTCSGVPTAHVAYCRAAGLPLPAFRRQIDGVTFVSLFEDIYSRRKDGESFLLILRDYLKDVASPHVFAYWSWTDPMPALCMGTNQVRQILHAMLRKLSMRLRGSGSTTP